jgi:hypothetical protein
MRGTTMIQLTVGKADLEAWHYWHVQHPDPRIHVRMEALDVRSQGVAHADLLRVWGISNASFHRYLHACVTGGIEPLQHLEPRRRSALPHPRATLEAEFRQRRPESKP